MNASLTAEPIRAWPERLFDKAVFPFDERQRWRSRDMSGQVLHPNGGTAVGS
jgi:hypothetical protein